MGAVACDAALAGAAAADSRWLGILKPMTLPSLMTGCMLRDSSAKVFAGNAVIPCRTSAVAAAGGAETAAGVSYEIVAALFGGPSNVVCCCSWPEGADAAGAAAC